jgi:hypothetical protein
VQWKANVAEGVGGRPIPSEIWAGAGPINAKFSPTRLSILPG